MKHVMSTYIKGRDLEPIIKLFEEITSNNWGPTFLGYSETIAEIKSTL